MKINPETRHQDLALYVKEHLESLPVEQSKLTQVVLIFVLYDIPLYLSLLSIFKIEFIWFASPFVLFIHLWLIRILVKNVYSTQLEMVLYMGCWTLLSFISLFVLFLGMLYYYFHITSVVSHIIITLATVVTAYILVRYQIKNMLVPRLKKEKGVINQDTWEY